MTGEIVARVAHNDRHACTPGEGGDPDGPRFIIPTRRGDVWRCRCGLMYLCDIRGPLRRTKRWRRLSEHRARRLGVIE